MIFKFATQNNIVKKSKIAQKSWSKLSIDERIEYLKKAGNLLAQKAKGLAILLSKEMGKDLGRSSGEVNSCAGDITYRADEVKKAIETLPDDFRLVVVLSFLEGFSYQEIADITDLQLGTVKSRLHRGRKLLQKELFEYAIKNGYVKDNA